MSRRKTRALKAALGALHYSGARSLLAPYTRGEGAILMLHRVTPEPPAAFAPNRILAVTPRFLEDVVRHVIEAGYDVLRLDEIPERLAEPKGRRPFVTFTLDDGYRDNAEHAWPIFKRYGIPFAIYVPTDYPDGRGELWWLALEAAIARLALFDIEMDGRLRRFGVASAAAKDQAYHEIYWWLRRQDERELRAAVGRICQAADVDQARMCRALIMNWNEIAAMAADPLVTIGAHTRAHLALAKLPEALAREEMAESARELERRLGRRIAHFSYPYGDAGSAGEREFALARELGFATAVTTRKGIVRREGTARLMALPRLSLNGDYQDMRYVRTLLSGAPFALSGMAGRMRRRAG